MIELNKKQKIAIIIMSIIIIIVIGYYLWDRSRELELIINQDETYVTDEIEDEGNEATNEIVVHIAGAVEDSGIQRLPENSRVADAIEAAGGLSSDANTNGINLAQKIIDGQKIYIPNVNDDIGEMKIQSEEVTSISENVNNHMESKVNINTATQTELESLPRNWNINSQQNYKL